MSGHGQESPEEDEAEHQEAGRRIGQGRAAGAFTGKPASWPGRASTMRCAALCQARGRNWEVRVKALVANDLAALDAIEGKTDEALEGWRKALEIDGALSARGLNRDLVDAELTMRNGTSPASIAV